MAGDIHGDSHEDGGAGIDGSGDGDDAGDGGRSGGRGGDSGRDGSRSSGSSGSSGDSGGSEAEDDERTLEQREAELTAALADVPFEVLERLASDGRGPGPAAARAAAAAAKARSFHREHKNRPQEISSKRPVSRFREVIQVPKQPSKDPRFEATIGGRAFNRDAFAERYAFLFDEVLPAERARVGAALKKERREGRRRELQAQLARLQQQLSDERSRRKAAALEHGWKAEERAAVAAGKTPFFLGKQEKRKRLLVAQYEELKASGRLEKYMEKRRKKNAAKDHRYLPSGRRAAGAAAAGEQ